MGNVCFMFVVCVHVCVCVCLCPDGSQGCISLWGPFQNAAGSVTILYRGNLLSADSMQYSDII